MKVYAMRVSYFGEPILTIHIFSAESGKLIDVFKCVESKSSRKEFMKYAEAKGWKVARKLNI